MKAFPRPVAAFLATAGVVLSAACWFERRPEPRNGQEDAGGADAVLMVADAGVRDSVRAVVAAFHDALRVGDGGRVASLSVPGATIVDQEEAVAWRLGAGGGERIPAPLLRGDTDLGWVPAGSDFLSWDGTALVVDRYTATVAGEEVPWTAVETLVLERTADGWRIRHVHRSRGGPPPVSRPFEPSLEDPS